MAIDLKNYLRELTIEFPHFRIIDKSSARSQRFLDALLKVVSFGRISQYLTHFHTTIGQRIYVCPDWYTMSDDDKYILLRHEIVHVRQFKKLTVPGMIFVYIVAPLPIGLSWFRAMLEREGYRETIRATAEVYGPQAVTPRMLASIVDHFVGPDYGWMWPFRPEGTR